MFISIFIGNGRIVFGNVLLSQDSILKLSNVPQIIVCVTLTSSGGGRFNSQTSLAVLVGIQEVWLHCTVAAISSSSEGVSLVNDIFHN